jgi:hypothetical protein
LFCVSSSAGSGPGNLVGYRAQRHTDVIDVERIGAYEARITGSRSRRARTGG